MTAFERAWDLVKMGYAGMPLDETSSYYDYIAERLGLGEPFDTGEQRRVFNIPNQPNFVAKVVNSGGLGRDAETRVFEPGATDSGMWEDFVYPRLAGVIPNTAEKYLVPGEAMGLEENISGVVRQPRVNVHPFNPQDPRNSEFHDTKARDWQEGFLASAREELPDPIIGQRDLVFNAIHRFMNEQDYGPGNFSENMRLLDYYWPYKREGIFE